MIYHVTHKTTYRYSAPVSLCQNLAHLTPREVPFQACRRSVLTIKPQPKVRSEHFDCFGNPTTYFSIQEQHRDLMVTAVHEVEIARPLVVAVPASPAWEMVRDGLARHLAAESLAAYEFAFPSRFVPHREDLADYARESFQPDRPLLEAAIDLMRRINTDFIYDTKATTVSTPLEEVFTRRRGVCQDFAHLQISCLRSLGLAARYVSGYLPTDPPPGQQRLIGADASHAWLAVYCPSNGWVDLDPTNNAMPTNRHIVLAWGRDYDDVSPIKGVVLGGGRHEVKATVDVVELTESPSLPDT
ncbi:MAG: transglutaminase family protein [Gemmataceae bacterium]